MSIRKRRRRWRKPKRYDLRIRHRMRQTPGPEILTGRNYYTVNGGRSWLESAPSVYKCQNNGRTYIAGEATWDQLHPGPPYRMGGPLFKVKFTDPVQPLVNTGVYYGWLSASIGYKYVGGFVPLKRMRDFDPEMASVASTWTDRDCALNERGDVSSYGATGWNKFKPGKPSADAGVFLGELRELPRMLKTTALGFHKTWKSMGGAPDAFGPKKVADHWLNTQFGWMPFLSDLRKFYNTYENLDKLLNQAIRDNGRWIRRRGTVSKDMETTQVASSQTSQGHWPALMSYFYPAPLVTGNHAMTLHYQRKVWFEGAFRYWIPNTKSVFWRARATAELFGAMPCPSLVWNLLPWSWLVDWFSNVGDVLSNLSTGYADNLAAKYAYVMGTTTWKGVLTSSVLLKSGVLQHAWDFPCEWKSRYAASPFGFGLTDADLSLRQWSILAALGITRLKT